LAQLTADEITKRIVAALKSGPRSRDDITENVFHFDVNPRALTEAFDLLVEAGKARAFANWPFPWQSRTEFWTLTAAQAD
jgi:hypothetical protein